MRFDELFDDLEGQLERELEADAAHRRADEERLRLARLELRDRIAAVAGADGGGIRLRLANGEVFEARPATIGRDWLAADLADGAQCILPLAAVAALSLTPEQSRLSVRRPSPDGRESGGLLPRVGIGVVLRDLARRRVPVDLRTMDAGVLHGTIDRAGADHLDLAVHERGRPRRESAVSELRVVALRALLWVRP
jgi:hypothetical protein